MRTWSHHEKISPIFPRSDGARRAHGSRGRQQVRVAVGGHHVHRSKDRLHFRTLRRWVRERERETGQREGTTTAESERLKALEREVRTNCYRQLSEPAMSPGSHETASQISGAIQRAHRLCVYLSNRRLPTIVQSLGRSNTLVQTLLQLKSVAMVCRSHRFDASAWYRSCQCCFTSKLGNSTGTGSKRISSLSCMAAPYR